MTDGVGGFACGTVDGRPTRRYHGLLIAVPPGHTRRHLFLAGFDEGIRNAVGDRGALMPPIGDGTAAAATATLTDFALDPATRTEFAVCGARLARQILVPKGRPAVLCRYELLEAEAPLVLELAPRLACRDVDHLHYRNEVLDPRAEWDGSILRVRPYASLPAVVLRVATDAAVDFDTAPRWTCGIAYPVDRARGYDGREDHFVPGTLRVELAPKSSILVAVSLDAPVENPRTLFDSVLDLRRKARRMRAASTADSRVRARLDSRADDFLQVVDGRLGICAGYPWFWEWGRDTCIALAGLTLARGRVDQCARVLQGILPFVRDGLVPNIFGRDPDSSHYGSVDAALWFARAVDQWRRADGRRPALDEALDEALLAIATGYHDGVDRAGDLLGIRADHDGLLHCGDGSTNATWMDARLPEGPVTPRHGKPVEIQALWCSLLDMVAELPSAQAQWRERRDLAFASFEAAFWLPPTEGSPGMLADRVDPDGRADRSIRPNMVLAAALPRSPLSDAQRAAVLAVCDQHLLTPRGLRTLSPSDPAYQPRYRGDVVARDRAYHQGTVWPWLLGAWVELALRVRGRAAEAELRSLLDGFAPELDRVGLDHVSEVFDGDAPHEPGGTIAQAWNTGELLRAYALLEELR